MQKYKNENHSSPLKSFTERTMFLKMQNSAVLKGNIISTAGKNKKMLTRFYKKP